MLLLLLTIVAGCQDCHRNYNQFVFINKFTDSSEIQIRALPNKTLLAKCNSTCVSHDNGVVVHCDDDCYFDPCISRNLSEPVILTPNVTEFCTNTIDNYCLIDDKFRNEETHVEVCNAATIHSFMIGVLIAACLVT